MSASLLQSRSTVLLSPRGWTKSSITRYMATRSVSEHPNTPAPSQQVPPPILEDAPNTHFKVTLRRSGISLGDKVKGTLEALGLHRRFQTVYHRHTPEAAGMILKLKELVEVENVPTHLVRTKEEQTLDRKAIRGYTVVRNRRDSFMNI